MYCLSKWWQCKRWELLNYLLTKIAHHYSTLLKFRLAKNTPQKKISGAHRSPANQSFWHCLGEQFGVVFRNPSGLIDGRIYTVPPFVSVKGIGSSSMGQQVGVRIQGWWSIEQDRLLGDQWSKPIDLRKKQQELGDFLGGVISNILPSCRNLQETIHTTKRGSTGHVFYPNLRECLGFSPRPWGRYSWRAIPTGW